MMGFTWLQVKPTIASASAQFLGLYNLASITTEQRIKEIGIRKVIGATTKQIVMMLSRQYLFLVLIGFMIALPLSIYVLNKWLETFAYRDKINIVLLIGGCLISMLVGMLTVSFKSWNAGSANPVKSLRAE